MKTGWRALLTALSVSHSTRSAGRKSQQRPVLQSPARLWSSQGRLKVYNGPPVVGKHVSSLGLSIEAYLHRPFLTFSPLKQIYPQIVMADKQQRLISGAVTMAAQQSALMPPFP